MKLSVKGPALNQASVCEPILRALPDWFGIEEANAQYIQDIEALPTFIAYANNDPVGFLTLKQHNVYAAEVYVMGVKPTTHRQGIGRVLLTHAEAHLRQQNVEYLQVKTLGPSHPDNPYARTRAFYRAMGFRPLEELKTLWDEANPCLLMVKKL
jgi:ribosomal protein S18 acetylase RimI-like enzyme